MIKIAITVKSDANINETFKLVQLLGVGEASLNDNVITGMAPKHLIGPLRNTTGIASVNIADDRIEPAPAPSIESAELPPLRPAPIASTRSFFHRK